MNRFVVVGLGLLVGCSDEAPDSGYGKNQPVPTQVSCYAACDRLADCAAQLCNEDEGTMKYSGIEDLLLDDCLGGCDNATIATSLEPSEWACMFTASCRELLSYDTCDLDSHYSCHRN